MVTGRLVRRLTGLIIAGLIVPVLALPPVETAAQNVDPAAIGFNGVAKVGSENRTVRFRFFCSPNRGRSTGILSAQIEIPKYEQLKAVFNFEPFEGPIAHAGALTTLQTNAAEIRLEDTFTATGSVLAAEISAGAFDSFLLEVNAAQKESPASRKLANVLRPLTDSPGTLTWRQDAAKPGDTPVYATLELTQPRVEQMKAVLHQCFPSR